MRILILEDRDSRRQEMFNAIQNRSIPIEVDFATSAYGCIRALVINEYDVLLLDHDLNDEVPVDKCFMVANNGMTVVNFLCSGWIALEKVIIHSDNAIRSREMRDLLCAAGYNAHRCAFGEYRWLEHLK